MVAVLALALLLPRISALTSSRLPHQLYNHYTLPGRPSPSALYYIQEPANDNGIFGRVTSDQSGKTASFSTGASESVSAKTAVDELVDGIVKDDDDVDLVFLFVGQYHAESFEEIVRHAQQKLKSHSNTPEIVVVLGGGVIGGGSELDQTKTPAMSILAGNLPPQSFATLFQYEEGVDQQISDILPDKNNDDDNNDNVRPPSYMVFSDPFAPLDELLSQLEGQQQKQCHLPPVIAGGVSVPPRQRVVPSIARNGKVLPAGSLVGVQLTGNVGLSAVVAQGCRPVGPTFVITQASGTILTGLSGDSAIARLEQVAADAEKQDQELIRNGELVCGIGSSNNIIMNDKTLNSEEEQEEDIVLVEDDFLIRQIMGFQPKSGSIVVAAGGLKEGNTFRFHVRAAKSAREDMDLMIQRAKTERLFAGSSSVGKPLAAIQFSCVARGSGFFGATNVDLKKVEDLFDDSDGDDDAGCDTAPIAGFFANGEIGPVGIRTAEMVSEDNNDNNNHSPSTFLHGFTTVVAMLCDYSESETTDTVSSSAIICDDMEDAWA